jgi:pSer/pThr/pTyr-binding forkhead associated (FHA) protein
MVEPKSKLTLVKFNQAELSKGRHILIVESPESRRAVSLNVNVFSLGRHPNNNLVLTDKLASRHHATIAWMRYSENEQKHDYAYWIIDGKGKRKRSRNGIYVNGTKKPLHRLVSGDIITIANEIKITYNYIIHSTETRQFLEYCDNPKPLCNSTKETNYKETIIYTPPQ